MIMCIGGWGGGGGGVYYHIWPATLGMSRCERYGFQAVYSEIGHINQRVSVYNRVSFSRKLINWLKI